MSDIYRAVKDKEYMDKTGETSRRKRADKRDKEEADKRMRESMGDDHPNPYGER